jgi:hypothetical protein
MHAAFSYRRCCRIKSARTVVVAVATLHCGVLPWPRARDHPAAASPDTPIATGCPERHRANAATEGELTSVTGLAHAFAASAKSAAPNSGFVACKE